MSRARMQRLWNLLAGSLRARVLCWHSGLALAAKSRVKPERAQDATEVSSSTGRLDGCRFVSLAVDPTVTLISHVTSIWYPGFCKFDLARQSKWNFHGVDVLRGKGCTLCTTRKLQLLVLRRAFHDTGDMAHSDICSEWISAASCRIFERS